MSPSDQLSKTVGSGFKNQERMVSAVHKPEEKQSTLKNVDKKKMPEARDLKREQTESSYIKTSSKDRQVSRSSSRKSKKQKLEKKRGVSNRSSEVSFSHMSTHNDKFRTMKTKRSKKNKSGTPILKFAKTLNDFRKNFKDHSDKLDEIQTKIQGFDAEVEFMHSKYILYDSQLSNINDIMKVLQEKIGFFETKGSQHFRKHYMGPLANLENFRKEFLKRTEYAFKELKDIKDDHIKRMVKIENDVREHNNILRSLKGKYDNRGILY